MLIQPSTNLSIVDTLYYEGNLEEWFVQQGTTSSIDQVMYAMFLLMRDKVQEELDGEGE